MHFITFIFVTHEKRNFSFPFLSDLESKYDTKTLSVDKDILEKNNSQWEVKETGE